MTNLAVVESLKYGLKLFAYLLTVVVLGGGGMVLGSALAGPELTDGVTTSAELFGGLVLAFLGLAVWVTGTFGIAYKLIADAVQWGVSTGTSSLSMPVPEKSERPEETAEPASTASIGPSPGEQAAREYGAEPTVPGAASVPDRVVERTADSSPATGPTAHQQVEERDRPATGTDHPPATNEAVETQEPVGEAADSRDDPLEEPASAEDAPAKLSSSRPNEHETHEATEHNSQPRDEELHGDQSDPPEPTAEEIAFGRNETDEMRTEQTRDRVDEPESDSAPADEEEPTAATEGDGSASATGVPESDTGEGTIPAYDSVSTSTPLETDEQPFEAQSPSNTDEIEEDGSDVETADSRLERDGMQAGNGLSESAPDDQQDTDNVDFFASTPHDQPDETAFEDSAEENDTEGTAHRADAVDTADEDGTAKDVGTVDDAGTGGGENEMGAGIEDENDTGIEDENDTGIEDENDAGIEDETPDTAGINTGDPLSDPLDEDE